MARWVSDSWRWGAPENTRLSDQISMSVASKPLCRLVLSQAFQNPFEGTHEPRNPADRTPLAVSWRGEARGAPWFPKNLYTRAQAPLGLPPGGNPFDQRARLGLRPSSSMGNRTHERGHARYLVHPWSLLTGDQAAAPPYAPMPPLLTLLPIPCYSCHHDTWGAWHTCRLADASGGRRGGTTKEIRG
jgi:hypothetical protein